MIEAATTATSSPFQWGPIILLALGVIVSAAGFFFKSILNTLQKLSDNFATISTKLAVMQEHANNTDSDVATVTKYHDEIIEHKAALRELHWRVGRLDGQDDSFGMTVPKSYREAKPNE